MPVLAFESIACGFVLFKGLQHWRFHQAVGVRSPSLLRILIRDSIGYFIMLVRYPCGEGSTHTTLTAFPRHALSTRSHGPSFQYSHSFHIDLTATDE